MQTNQVLRNILNFITLINLKNDKLNFTIFIFFPCPCPFYLMLQMTAEKVVRWHSAYLDVFLG